MDDLALLRAYEPVVRYTKGELFFPCAVDGYLARCHLWMADAERKLTLAAQPGDLTAEKLAEYRDIPQNHRLFLQYVATPMSAVEYQRWLRHPSHPTLESPSRLQRVGLVTRILDGLFDLSLLLRGRVPGGTVAAAHRQYTVMQARDARRAYYGRVVRDGGYIVLHYLFFFAMNDWRSSFHGVNDHESDWEQILIYLADNGDTENGDPEYGENLPTPQWVAFASHDFSGDDLRRRWDDPEIEKSGDTHPVIYAGAGSHASYFSRGEYLMQVEPKFLVPIRGIGAALDRFWTNTLRQGTPLNLESAIQSLQSIPFVDYARGDGRAIGPGQEDAWTPILISDQDGWVDGYRGLWGLDTWDPFGGERAPSGPKYNRDGSVRLSWSYPLAWAGLDKVLPPREALTATELLLTNLRAAESDLLERLELQRSTVRKLELEVDILRSTEYLSALLRQRESDLAAEEEKLRRLSTQLNATSETLEAGAQLLTRRQAGDFGSPRAHIHHAHTPLPPIHPPSRFVRLWVALSGGLILLLIVALAYFRPPAWPVWLVAITVLFGAVEAATRGRLTSFLLRLTLLLALVTTAILLARFWLTALVIGMAVVVIIMIRDNLRELFNF